MHLPAPPNHTFDRTAGSHALAAAGQRERSVLDNTRGKETCDYYERSQSIGAIFCTWNSTGIPGKQPAT
jgi:hypothetical protein